MASSALTRERVAAAQLEGDFTIKSESTQPKLDTSQWPLLLKNYDKLLVRSSHFTPIPSGSSPLKRDIISYVKYDVHTSTGLTLDLAVMFQVRRDQPRQAFESLLTRSGRLAQTHTKSRENRP